MAIATVYSNPDAPTAIVVAYAVWTALCVPAAVGVPVFAHYTGLVAV